VSFLSEHINQLQASEAFSKQAPVFDQLYGSNSIIAYKRKRVRDHILKYISTGRSMLELNCGTGDDALFFAKKGFRIHATDISEEMLSILNQKLNTSDLEKNISSENCSFTELETLHNRGPFDVVYSNFGGLNCTGALDKVLHELNPLVKHGGIITLVIISKFCLWETLLLFKGKFKTAFRRFFSKHGRKAHIEGHYFKCWYYAPSFIKNVLKKDFDLLNIEGLCTIVPPSYIENFAEKYPRLFSFLKRKEDSLKSRWPWKYIGDYFIVSLKKK
jgi:ubiquinone/menaquinone biosynthesis C-methylase UbiE